MSDYDLSIHTNPDAVAWAKFFMKTMKEREIVIDEGLMIAWFANAMMAMHDHLKGAPINGDHAEYLLEQEAKVSKFIDAHTKPWVGLTDDEVDSIEHWAEFKEAGSGPIPVLKLIAYIEAKLKEKNHAL